MLVTKYVLFNFTPQTLFRLMLGTL